MWRADSLEKILMLGKIPSRRRRMQQRTSWLDSVIDSKNMNMSKIQEIVKDRGAWCAAVHGVIKCQSYPSDWKITIPIPEWLSAFPYFLWFKPEFCSKELIIWAAVSSQSCFCWLYRASSSLAAMNIISFHYWSPVMSLCLLGCW